MADSLREPLIAHEISGPKLSAIDECGERKNGEQKVVSESDKWVLPEIQKVLWLAAPMVGVNLLQYALNLVSIMFVGHQGELALASAAVATSLCGVTGYSILIGMASALETLCGQAYGAKRDHMVGVYMQRAILVLNITAVPIAFVWYNVDSILLFIGQDPEISYYAGLFSKCMLPTVFAYATLSPLTKFLQAQSAVLPMAVSSTFTLCLHIIICWLVVFKIGFGYRGAAIANSISQWLNVLFLVVYIKFSPRFKKTWTGFSTEAFDDMRGFFKLAIPSAIMICLEYWSFELMVLSSGLLPNPQLEMSTLALCLNSIALAYMIPMGIGAAVSTRVSNELGAGKAYAAKRSVKVAVSMGLGCSVVVSALAMTARNVWPYAFTNEPEVVHYVSSLIPYLAVLVIGDALQGVLCGVLRGCGNQELGAYTNLGAYYLVGVPLALTLAFHFHWNDRGLWIGMIAALTVQSASLLVVAVRTNWEQQAKDALNRVCHDQLPTTAITVEKET